MQPQVWRTSIARMSKASEDTFFNDSWTVYAHSPNDVDWTHKSYRVLGVLSSVDDFWTMWNSIKPFADRVMLFCMREHVFPAWDDPECIDGCIVSYVVPVQEAAEAMCALISRALGEILYKHSVEWSMVNGVSIGPKKGICVLRVWMKTCDTNPDDLNVPHAMTCDEVRVQPCRRRIESNRAQ